MVVLLNYDSIMGNYTLVSRDNQRNSDKVSTLPYLGRGCYVALPHWVVFKVRRGVSEGGYESVHGGASVTERFSRVLCLRPERPCISMSRGTGWLRLY